jgi:hypothetical protein
MRSRLGLLIALTALAGCGGHSTAPANCPRSGYRVSVGAQGATGSLVGMAGVIARRRSACHLQAGLTFAVQQKAGGSWKTIQPMAGNPAHTQLVGLLKRGAPIGHDWAWSNYCGPHGQFRFVASADGQNATIAVTPPVCNSGGTGPGGIQPFPPKAP